jgi:thiosulfate dehydrogenase [quinone] large subunit
MESAMAEQRQIWLRNIALSYALFRIALGMNICLHGVVRWSAGLTNFAESLVGMFQKTLLPAWSVYGSGSVLPVVETIIGTSIFLGFQTRRALISGSIPMLVLTFGSTLRARLGNGRDSAHLFCGLFLIVSGRSL